MISVGLFSKILLPHHLYASIFAFIVLLTEASPSLCAQLESAVYTKYTDERNLALVLSLSQRDKPRNAGQDV